MVLEWGSGGWIRRGLRRSHRRRVRVQTPRAAPSSPRELCGKGDEWLGFGPTYKVGVLLFVNKLGY